VTIDWGKLVTFTASIIAVTVLAALGRLDGVVAVGVIFTVVGYTAGNGKLAVAGKPTQPMIRPSTEALAATADAEAAQS